MDVKYQVFISSTFKDLEEERRAAIESVLNLGHIPVGMELFQAGDETQWSYIKRRIDECDYYLVVVAERYGSEVRGKSYTQLEYEYAVKRKKPIAAFLLHPEARAAWPQERVEFEKRAKVDSFRALCQKKLVKQWRTADDLSAKIATTLVELTREKPQIGWVRADSLPTASVLSEIAHLSEEKRELQRQLEALRTNDKVVIPPEATWRLETLRNLRAADFLLLEDGETTETSVLTLFLALSRVFADGIAMWDIGPLIADSFNLRVAQRTSAAVNLVRELVANAVVEARTKQRSSFRGELANDMYYFLTDFGKQLIMYAEIGGYVENECAAARAALRRA